MTFQIGDRVEVLVDHVEGNEKLMSGDLGTVCSETFMIGAEMWISVDWDVSCGHNCGGKAREHHGWNVQLDKIRLAQEDMSNPEIEVEDGDLFAILGGAL